MEIVDEASALFASAGLGKPPVPRALGSQLRKRGEWHYATQDAPEISPYTYRDHEAAARSSEALASLVLAHAGHGVNSYAISYYLILGNVRILLQLGWGGVYMDNDAAGQRIRIVFEMLQQQLPEIELRSRRATLAELYYSDFYSGRSQKPSPQDLASEVQQLLAPR